METQLRRSKDKVIAGVCGGLASYFKIDPAWMRVLFVIFSLLTAILTGVVVYLVLWLIMLAEA